MATVNVLDSSGNVVAIEKPNGNGRAAAASSRPVALATEDLAAINAITTALGGSLAVTGTFYPATQTISGNVGVTGSVAVTGPLTDTQLRASAVPISGNVGVTGSVAVTGTFYQATQPVSIADPVAVTGTFWQATQPVSAASLPLPTGAATAAAQATNTAAIATIGTRAYGTAATRLAYSGTSAQSAAITGTEVLLHNCGTARCYVKAGTNPTATANDIPVESGEKFHLRITTGDKIAAIQDSASGNLNIVPVA